MQARAASADSTFENTPFPTAQQMSLKPRSYQIGAGSVKRPPRTRSLHPPTRHCRPLAGLCGGGGGKGRGAPLGCSPCDCRDGRCLPHPAHPCPRGTAGPGKEARWHTRAGGHATRGHTVETGSGGGAEGRVQSPRGAGPHFLSRCLNLGPQLHPEHKERLFSNKNILLAPGENGKF